MQNAEKTAVSGRVRTLTIVTTVTTSTILAILLLFLLAGPASPLRADRDASQQEPDYNPADFSRQEAIAIFSSENHDIMAPHSSQEMPVYRKRYRRTRSYRRTRRKAKRYTYYKYYKHAAWLSSNLYLVEKHADSYILYVKKLPWTRSVLLATAPVYIPRKKRYDVYALRSIKPLAENGNSQLLYRGRYLGSEQDLHFLNASQVTEHETLGKCYRIAIPFKVVYGYWQTKLGSFSVSEGTVLRLVFYSQPHTPTDTFSRSYRIRIDH